MEWFGHTVKCKICNISVECVVWICDVLFALVQLMLPLLAAHC